MKLVSLLVSTSIAGVLPIFGRTHTYELMSEKPDPDENSNEIGAQALSQNFSSDTSTHGSSVAPAQVENPLQGVAQSSIPLKEVDIYGQYGLDNQGFDIGAFPELRGNDQIMADFAGNQVDLKQDQTAIMVPFDEPPPNPPDIDVIDYKGSPNLHHKLNEINDQHPSEIVVNGGSVISAITVDHGLGNYKEVQWPTSPTKPSLQKLKNLKWFGLKPSPFPTMFEI